MNLKCSILTVLVVFFALTANAQFTEDFSDGDLTNNPSWIGDLSEFQVNNEAQLQLFDTDASETASYISTQALTKGAATWDFWVKLEFNPSTSNFARIYLNANNSNLTEDLDGYYIQIGGVSGDVDAVELFRQDGSSRNLILSGEVGGAAVEPNIRVSVSRDENNNWELFTDLTGGNDLVSRGTVFDDTYTDGNYFGYYCRYTSTRSELFFMDDIMIDPLFVDVDPPELLNVLVENESTLSLCFNERVANTFVNTNFQIDNGINIFSADINVDDQSKVILTLGNELQDGVTYTVTAEDIADDNNNVLASASLTFDFVEIQIASGFEILINEIMADPTPVIALPEAEFIELYNPSSKNFNLEMYSISDGGAQAVLPNYTLEANEYVIITKDINVDAFENIQNIIGIPDFPQLSNASDQVLLFNQDNELVHQVVYSDEFYGSTEKQEGGYTLELINPGSPCMIDNNWIGSDDLSGGTPGRQNSVFQLINDTAPPSITSVFPLTTRQIELRLSEAYEINTTFEISNFDINNNAIPIISVGPGSDSNIILIETSTELVQGITYELTITSISDCIGNESNEPQSFEFALPQDLEEGDIIINEILFNPATSGVDFLELYNNSDKVINAARLIVGNLQDGDIDIENVLVEQLIYPNTYFTITASPVILNQFYTIADPANLFENNLPGFADRDGNITVYSIINGEQVIADAFDYTQDFHFPLLEDKNGVSLERISFDALTQDQSNWQSAASTSGFATPTAPNSQAFTDPRTSMEGIIELIHPTFSPDQDGFEDFLQINLTPTSPGNLATIKIFDKVGREIKTVANNELISLNNSFIWDGTTDSNTIARMGIYILWIQLHDADGNVEQFKKAVVLAKRL